MNWINEEVIRLCERLQHIIKVEQGMWGIINGKARLIDSTCAYRSLLEDGHKIILIPTLSWLVRKLGFTIGSSFTLAVHYDGEWYACGTKKGIKIIKLTLTPELACLKALIELEEIK